MYFGGAFFIFYFFGELFRLVLESFLFLYNLFHKLDDY